MPPRPKFQREDIILAGCEVVKEAGINAVVAREVARKLGTTTAPIFTYFSTMDELKQAIYENVMEHYLEYICGSLEYEPAFKEFGIRWIQYAKDYPNYYVMLFMEKDLQKGNSSFMNPDLYKVMEPMRKEVEKGFRLTAENTNKLIQQMVLYAQGIATMIVNGLHRFDESTLVKDFSEVCLSLVAGYTLEQGEYDEVWMKAMFRRAGSLPVRKA